MYTDIIRFLEERRLKEALAQLYALTIEAECWNLQTETETLQSTYNYMLQYAAQGTDDPERNHLYNKIRRKAYELADEADFLNKSKKGNGYFSEKVRQTRQNPPHSFSEIELSLESFTEDLGIMQLEHLDQETFSRKQKDLFLRHEKTTDELFNKIWHGTHWTEEEQNEANALLNSLLVPVNDLAVMVSAVTLSLFRMFDARKFKFLLNAYRSRKENIVSQRALIGILLVAYYQGNRITLYPELLAELSLMSESESCKEQANTIQILLLLSRETEKIDKKMREEIIPQMIKKTQRLKPDFKITDIDDPEDKNPEWEKDIDEINRKIQELGELQMEGADTYMGTFAQLKNYPFFKQAAHWFYPFDKQVSEIAEIFTPAEENAKSFINILLDSPVFCNSDKYSFCLALSSIPGTQRSMLSAEISEQNEAVRESMDKLATEKENNNKANVVSRQYIHDLYRFYKLWIFRNEQHDIFKDQLDLWKCDTLKPLFNQPERLKQIADHLFAKDYLSEASELYTALSQTLQTDAGIKQKLGFSLQKLKKYQDAVNVYKQADILNPDHAWTLKHMGQCFKHMHEYEQALECFYRAENIQPENLNLLLQIGQCLATLRNYDKALTYFFKVEYLEKAPANAQRAIGWCYFMTGKYEDALKFYEKLLQSPETQTSDWLNTGHIYMASGNIPKATECYREVQKRSQTHDEFLKLYWADK